ncbi:MAG: hypothetical protein IKL88_03085 [Erysipelotrichales bacterium]|nr:hypothetical protein [Erysipelotrichales bacterium]
MIDIMMLNKECGRGEEYAKDSNTCLQEWENYTAQIASQIQHLSVKEAAVQMISEQNWLDRSQLKSCDQMGILVEIGDICFIEFGRAFVYEVGYQHFGLVVSKCNGKALVIPMTSNTNTYEQAYDEVDNPHGKKHLIRIGQIPGLHRPSVLFLNDAKYINTARIISVKAHIASDSELFKNIMRRMLECIFYPM